MKLTYVTNACVIIEHEGKRVMCDPWLIDGAYYGSWFHYPALKVAPEDFASVDFIYISHIHPDHMDVRSLQRLPKHLPILILDYAEKFLLHHLQRLGFQTIHELPNGESFQFGPHFSIQIFAADNCNPEVCGHFFGCSLASPHKQTQQLDSLAVFKGGEKTICNTNDCPYAMSWAVCDQIMKEYPYIDFLLVGYRSAGPYPQCFDSLSVDEKEAEALKGQKTRLELALDYIRHLKARAFLPFAGQYVLSGKLVPLNAYILPDIEDLPQLFIPLLKQKKVASQLIMLNSMASYDLETEQISEPFSPPTKSARSAYLDTLKPLKFDYEDDDVADLSPTKLLDLLKQAHQKLQDHRKIFRFETDWKVVIDLSDKGAFLIPFQDTPPSQVSLSSLVEPYLKIRIDPRLFLRILHRKAHWNNAEIGSHLFFERRPNEFNRNLHFLMSFFHV